MAISHFLNLGLMMLHYRPYSDTTNMFAGPQQHDFATVMTEFGLPLGQDVCGGDPTGVTFVPNVRERLFNLVYRRGPRYAKTD